MKITTDNVVKVKSITDALLIKGFSPVINASTNTWMIFDETTKKYVDSGVKVAGTGIESIDTEESTESGGENKVTITLTDGSENTFIIRNGVNSTNDYNDIDNKPQINDVSLVGNLELTDLVTFDSTTLKYENKVLSVNSTNVAEAGNNQPITSAGVRAVVGNIETLLELI